MNHDVFISYSSHNRSTALAICHVLEEHKIKCWIAPRDIPGGADYGDIIDQAILDCKVFLLVFSESAVSSQWVRGEVNIAFSEGKPIVPYRIDDTELSGAMRLILNQMHWLDAYPDAESKFDELLETVNLLVSDGSVSTVGKMHDGAVKPDGTAKSGSPNMPNGGIRPGRKRYWRAAAIAITVAAVIAIVSGVWYLPVRKAADGIDIPDSISSVDTVVYPEKTAVETESDLRYKDSLAKVDKDRAALKKRNEEMSRKKRMKDSLDNIAMKEKARRKREEDSIRIESLKKRLQDSIENAEKNNNIQQTRDEVAALKRMLDSLDKVAKAQLEEHRRQEEARKKKEAEERRQQEEARKKMEAEEHRRQEEARKKMEAEEERKRNEAAASQENPHSVSGNSSAAPQPESAVAAVKEPANKSTENVVPVRTYKVGDYYEQNGKRGVVFEVDKSGQHGKIVGFEEFPDNQWCVLFDLQNFNYNIKVGAVNENDGMYNQKMIMALPSWSKRFPAFYLCIKSENSEWYIPAIDELKTLMLNRKVRGAVNAALRDRGGIIIGSSKKNSWYWSSTEENANQAYFVDVNMGVWNYYSKQAHGNVRIISAF